jgi:hypothetical protein
MSRINATTITGLSGAAPTFTNGVNVTGGTTLIGSATSTGTASQPLQVTGGAYVSANLGIGTTNPASRIDIYSPISGSTAIRAIVGPSYSPTLYPGNISGLSTNAASSFASQFAAAGVGATSGELGVYSFYPTFGNYPSDRGPRRAVDLVGGFTGTWGTEYFAINVGRGGFANDSAVLTNERLRVDGNGNVGIGTTNPLSRLTVIGGESRFGGVIETVSAATTYNSAAGALVLELDVRQATTYTYTIPTGANIGIVSFKNMPAPTGNSNGTTITCIFTQNAAGTGNTTGTTGIGTNCTVVGYENGAAVAGISTRALVGSGTTVTLSSSASDRDFVSFFVHYTGGTNTTASSYQVYATKNGGFRQGNVGV